MSVRENIELYGGIDNEQYLHTLEVEYGVTNHPRESRAYILEGLPFYAPRAARDHLSILSFNNLPLPDALLEALVLHPELFPDDVLVRWMQEQDLILEATLGALRGRATET
jgi:hypothetical protein